MIRSVISVLKRIDEYPNCSQKNILNFFFTRRTLNFFKIFSAFAVSNSVQIIEKIKNALFQKIISLRKNFRIAQLRTFLFDLHQDLSFPHTLSVPWYFVPLRLCRRTRRRYLCSLWYHMMNWTVAKPLDPARFRLVSFLYARMYVSIAQPRHSKFFMCKSG